MISDAEMKNLHVLNPLFWQRMDGHTAIREEMERMKEVGINDFIVEPRPHPDYLGPGWWDDLSFIIKAAEELDMFVWIFDDGQYPSGSAHGILAQKHPEHTKRFWRENHMDASGPLSHASFLINDWLEPGETVYKVIAARRYERGTAIYSDTLTDVTEYISGGRLYWPVPEGEWRIFLIKVSPYGEEAHTNHYVNPLSRESVSKYIELIHEQHYEHFKEYFGTRIAGFFTDEPRFGNTVGYDRIIGKSRMPLPYTPGIENELCKTPLGRFDTLIPLLWYDDVEGKCVDARYTYMDIVSALFAECFTGTLGNWCRDHGVKFIGHVVEENGAHSRLGYGAGHFFRAMEGLDAAGIDVVCNLFPEQTSGNYATAFNEYDCDFNHYGLAKMASSASKLDPKKNGRTLCEAFGAYGWGEGLRLMKWITDHLAVQGVNVITPHAFSPSPFPDPDCPPHFYARGENPQFRLFHVWSDYANRLLGTLIDARHTAPVAVVYHAEAEWGGECEPFEKVVKALAQKQTDCSVLPIDELVKPESTVVSKTLYAGGGEYKALVVPYSRFIPQKFADKLSEFTHAGLSVVFTKALPERVYFGGKVEIEGAAVSETSDLPDLLSDIADIEREKHYKDLLYSHYVKDGADLYFFVNQSTRTTVDTNIKFRDERPAVIFDPMTGEKTLPRQSGGMLRLKLYPWESRFVCFGEDTDGLKAEEYETADKEVYL